MFIPLISFVFGIIILTTSSLVYVGVPALKNIPFIFGLREQKITLLGLVLISLADRKSVV